MRIEVKASYRNNTKQNIRRTKWYKKRFNKRELSNKVIKENGKVIEVYNKDGKLVYSNKVKS